MSTYAKETKVPVSQSKNELEKLLVKYGADQFVSGWDGKSVMVQFRMRDRFIRVQMPMKDMGSVDRTKKEERRRWRSLILKIKGNLESVESEIVTFEQAFMAHIVMPDNKTIGDHVLPQVALAYKTGNLPKLLPGY